MRRGGARRLGLAAPREHARHADRREHERHGEGLAEQGGGEIDGRDIGEHALAQRHRVQCIAIALQRRLVEAAAVDIIEDEARQAPSRCLAQVGERRRPFHGAHPRRAGAAFLSTAITRMVPRPTPPGRCCGSRAAIRQPGGASGGCLAGSSRSLRHVAINFRSPTEPGSAERQKMAKRHGTGRGLAMALSCHGGRRVGQRPNAMPPKFRNRNVLSGPNRPASARPPCLTLASDARRRHRPDGAYHRGQ